MMTIIKAELCIIGVRNMFEKYFLVKTNVCQKYEKQNLHWPKVCQEIQKI